MGHTEGETGGSYGGGDWWVIRRGRLVGHREGEEAYNHGYKYSHVQIIYEAILEVITTDY